MSDRVRKNLSLPKVRLSESDSRFFLHALVEGRRREHAPTSEFSTGRELPHSDGEVIIEEGSRGSRITDPSTSPALGVDTL